MSSGKTYLAYILDQLAPIADDVTTRPMMGEYLLYYCGTLVGGIYPEFPYSTPFSTFFRRTAVEFSRKFAHPASRKPPKRRVV